MIRKLILLLFIGFYLNSYSQVGEYLSHLGINTEHNNKTKGFYFDHFTYLNVMPNRSFEIIITNFSSNDSDKNCCWKTKGVWSLKNSVLYLDDIENKQQYHYVIRENGLLDITYINYNHLNDDDLMLELISLSYLPEEQNTFLTNLGTTFIFKKIEDQSELHKFVTYKKSLCK